MRRGLFFLLATTTLTGTAFVGCGDGEEKASTASGTGGTGGDGGQCYSSSFTSPKAGSTLSISDDADSNCANGVQTTVSVATNAPDGTAATLLADGQEVGSTTAKSGTLNFSDVTFASTGNVELVIRFDASPACESAINIKTACGGPTCDLTKPTLSATHPELNGVPAAQGGDRVSADGQDYQAAFEVATNIEDGQPVSLTVDGKADVAVALAQSGVAKFPGVVLIPDGGHEVQATCRAQSGQTGASAKATFSVDSTGPALEKLTPSDGQFFGPNDDADTAKPGLQVRVCGETSSTDAIDLPASLGTGASNFCVGIGTATPTCAPATTGGAKGANGGCVDFDCPGGAKFDVSVTLADDAGNPTKKTIQALTCASSLPTVQIIEPVSGTGADVSTHILAASMTQTRKDQDSGKAGAQYTVVACSDVSGTATLRAGLAGASLPVVPGQVDIATQAAAPSDNCPSGYGHVVKFTNADLPESAQDGTNKLATATEFKVELKAASTALGTSPGVQVWVDSIAPTISEYVPTPLCGKLFQSATDVTQNLVLASTNSPVAAVVTSGSGPTNYPEQSYSSGFSNFGNVTFKQGTNSVTASTTEPSGNTGALKSPCVVTVGNPPVVSWVTPTQLTMFNASTDGAAGTPGWQGTLTVQTDVGGSGATVTFKLDCGGTITTIGTANIGAGGSATLAGASIPECAQGTLTAETSNISGKGVGTASISNKSFDTVVPGSVTGLAASVKSRRATTFALGWTGASDGGATVSGYDVRVSTAAINAVNFDAAEAVAFLGAPKAPGQGESLDVNSRMIETNYYFAVAATDLAGNRGPVASIGPAKATFNQTVLSGGANEQMGISLDGSTSVNGDAYADLVVGGRNSANVYFWFGAQSGYPSSPSVTISGVAGSRFGQAVSVVGDIDGDALPEIAIGAPLDGGNGKVYVFKGRATWPAVLTSSQADYVVSVDPGADSKFGTGLFGVVIARLGDLDQDGAADFAVGALFYGGGQGYVAVVRGVATGQTFPATVSVPQAVGTRVIAFVGDATAGLNWFGQNIVGLPGYYSGGHPALVVSSPAIGRLYAFQGDTGLTGTVSATSAKETYLGSAAMRTGNTLSNLGPIAGSAALGVGSPGLASNSGGDARIFYGTPAAMLGGAPAVITNSAATSNGDSFGSAVFGGGFSGSNVSVSLIGDSGIDVGLSSFKVAGAPAKLYLARGSKLGASGNIVALADVVIDLPANWAGSTYQSGPIKDSNDDGFADIALGEQGPGSATYNGRVIVLW